MGLNADDAARAAVMISDALRARPPERRGLFLRNVIVHAAAGLALTEGDEAAAQAVQRVATAVRDRAQDRYPLEDRGGAQ